MNWLRKLLIPPEPRATVTLYGDDRMMIGLGRDLRREEVAQFLEQVKGWKDRGYPPELIIFPFPVELTDLRPKR